MPSKTAGRDQTTRARVLDAATMLFAERGFRKVTVREICRRAKANVASVNYHFGDKQRLYREVLGTAIDVMRETTDAARLAGEGQPPDVRLRAYLHIFLNRLLGAGDSTWLHQLMMREMSEPTPAFDAVVDKGIRPRVEFLGQIVGELMGCPTDDERVMQSVASLQSQCVMAKPNAVTKRLWPAFTGTRDDIDRLAEHIADFSLAGIRAIAARGATAKRKPA